MNQNRAHNLGFPRMGKHRELKFSLEKYWAGEVDETHLKQTGQHLRAMHWQLQRDAGIFTPPSNDFSFYDHVLDTAAMVGAIPRRFRGQEDMMDLPTYFAMARGEHNVAAMEMTKWFDTNYHYVVPEFESGMQYKLSSNKPIAEYMEAKALGIVTRPVLLGPVSFILLGKATEQQVSLPEILRAILPIYQDVLTTLKAAGAEWVQVDEPCLVLDLDAASQEMYRTAYTQLSATRTIPKLLLATYFGDLGANLDLTLSLGMAGLHLDLVRAPQQLQPLLAKQLQGLHLSLGLVDGRNIWRTDLEKALRLIELATQAVGKKQIEISSSCSLLHSPNDLDLETAFDAELRSWMAFGKQKLEEIAILAKSLDDPKAIARQIADNQKVLTSRNSSARVHNPEVQQRLRAVTPDMLTRQSPYSIRRRKQADALKLPLLPTTTIGSFPQTAEVRKMRAAARAGKIEKATYEKFLEKEIELAIRFQEGVGLDLLVHGEFERNDMVEYFGEQLTGFVFSQHGWVQSYGSRCVKPPIIYGDVSRPKPMTVRWSQLAQSFSDRPVKGMLTGPVTILQWSFVRDDQPRADTCGQVALAIRDEVLDLESAGIQVIQIDEPAIREGLPLRRVDWPAYLQWSVDAFRLASAGVADSTQIHTHMCYAEFQDIMDAIVRLDADVISMECSRSHMELLDVFQRTHYPNEIGPGVYDIHSPRIPEVQEVENLLRKALEVLSPEQLWINPDCGLKTRKWEEVRQSLENLVIAAKNVRNSYTLRGA